MSVEALLAQACERTGTPGAVVGVLHAGALSVTAYGVLSRRTSAPVAAGSVFQIGSISKPWTATLVSQLAAEGRLTLDSTVAELLPGVRLGADDLGEQVTVRHLLTHSAGIDGDVFTDTGRGDDAVERYVDLLADAVTVHEPGAAYSYCNSGYVVLGRIVEVLDGTTWDEALARRLSGPLGLPDVCTLPEEALLRGAAVGHERDEAVTTWALPRSCGPAGTIITSAADLLGFAAAWLAADTPAHLTRMTEALTPIPDGTDLDAVGWGWRVGHWDEHLVLGHSGQTLGQTATLRVVPSLGLAVCVLSNEDHADALHQAVVPEVVHDLTGVAVPAPPGPDPTAPPTDLGRHVGVYDRRAARYEVRLEGDGLWLVATPTGELADHDGGPVTMPLVPRDGSGDSFVRRTSETDPWSTVSFGTTPSGTPTLFAQGRIAVRVS